MFDFGDELTIHRIPWLVWIQLLIMLLIIVFLYCCSIIAFDFSGDDSATSPSVLFASAGSDVDKPLRNSNAGAVISSHHNTKVCPLFPFLFFFPFVLHDKRADEILGGVCYYVIPFSSPFVFFFLCSVWLVRKSKRKKRSFLFPFLWDEGGYCFRTFSFGKRRVRMSNHPLSFSFCFPRILRRVWTQRIDRGVVLLFFTFFLKKFFWGVENSSN